MVNFALAGLILGLKLWLLPRFLLMPGMLCYLSASAVETGCYLLGWNAPSWSASVNVLAMLAVIEAPAWAIGMQSDQERSAVRKWCWTLGTTICAAGVLGQPIIYPNYVASVYLIRLYCALFCVGYLSALLGYCWTNALGVQRYVIHASILLLRLGTFGALLLVHDRSRWFQADLAGEFVNILTLTAWLWLIPRRAPAQLLA